MAQFRYVTAAQLAEKEGVGIQTIREAAERAGLPKAGGPGRRLIMSPQQAKKVRAQLRRRRGNPNGWRQAHRVLAVRRRQGRKTTRPLWSKAYLRQVQRLLQALRRRRRDLLLRSR